MKKRTLHFLIILITAAFMASCDDNTTGTDDPEPEIEVNTVEDLDADGKLTLFSLRNGEIINSEDSASTSWDVGFDGTTIYTNSSSSGPGSAGAILLDVSFDEVTIAPSEGYAVDTSATNLAIPTGSGNGWYNYNPSTHIVTPIPDKTIVLRTADENHYAKMEIISYYEGNPESPSTEDNERHYTFRYAIQLTEDLRELN